jgi:uncharacterized membrane protein (UPF0182 family)
VKATVDAYDGTVTLYQWDAADPVLKTWSKAFPGVVKPKSAISKDLLAHIRYPEDLFRVQRDILSSYHVTTASAFYEDKISGECLVILQHSGQMQMRNLLIT